MLNKTKLRIMPAVCLIAAGFSACSPKVDPKGGGVRVETGILPDMPVIGGGAEALPQAVVYRMSGDCADLVPITLSEDGKRVVSYPAPGDLSADCMPVDLGGGWWLDRRGVSPSSVFTDYTYIEYESMKHAPAVEDLLAHLNKDCVITRMVVLPITAAAAASDPSRVRSYIQNGFKDCKEIPMKK